MNKRYLLSSIFIIINLSIFVSSLPSEFDIRSIGRNSIVTDYKVRLQGVCLGQTWAQQIAQAVSNMQSIAQGIKINLSAQHLLQCTASVENKCHEVNIDIVHSALDYIKKEGLTFENCYPNQIMSLPGDRCKFKCKNGGQFPIRVRAKIDKIPLQNKQQMLSMLGKGNTVIMAVFMVDNGMNYVVPGNFQFDQQKQNYGQDEIFGVGIGQIVGWKQKGSVLKIRIGLGSQWGYLGYANVNVDKHKTIMLQYYALTSYFNNVQQI